MEPADFSITSNNSQDEASDFVGYSGEHKLHSSSGSNGNKINTNRCELIKQQYDQAMIELNAVRRQCSESARRSDEMASMLGFYKEQYIAAMKQLESSAEEHNKYTEVTKENARLSQQNMLLERNLRRLMDSVKQQEGENENEEANHSIPFYNYSYRGNNGNSGCPVVDFSNSNSNSNANNNTVTSTQKCDSSCYVKYEKFIEEAQLFKKMYSDMSKERNNVAVERDKLHIQLSATIDELDKSKKEFKVYRDKKDQFISQQEKEMEEMRSVMQARANELLTTKFHRNHLKEELNQILSERDNVLQEHQKMSDDLTATKKELDQKVKDEIKLQKIIDDLHKKIQLLEARESSWNAETQENQTKELEKLRKAYEKLRNEKEKSDKETDIAKSRRDWAISEREKIVQERDSVKHLCDELRRERDTAVSNLLGAIRDSEEIKKQNDESQRKIESLKEQLEQRINSNSTSRQSFRWSSFETDDVLEVELCNYREDDDIGLILDDTHNKQLVCGITNCSPAFGKLKVNDVIVKVNDLDCQAISKRLVVDAIRSSSPRCLLLVQRPKQTKRQLYTVHLNLQTNQNIGMHVETGVFISKIEKNSIASFEPELDVGDRILSINNKSMQGIQSAKEVMKILDDHRHDSLTIVALKNVQEGGNSCINGLKNRRMTNTSAQTDSNESMHKVTSSSKQPFFTEMINKFKKIHITKSGPEVDHLSQDSATGVLAALDSVIDENSEKHIFKRSKRNKKEKDTGKSMGTWPRATIINSTQENPTGTIVHRKKERIPVLSVFTGGGGGTIEIDSNGNQLNRVPQHGSSSSSTGSNAKPKPNRNSNPIPLNLFQTNPSGAFSHRHSVYTSNFDPESLILEQSKSAFSPPPSHTKKNLDANLRIKMPADKYGTVATNRHHANNTIHYQNRLSLNLTPSDNNLYKNSGQMTQQQHHQQNHHQSYQPNSLDFLGKKQVIDQTPGLPGQMAQHSKSPFTGINYEIKSHPSGLTTGNPNYYDVISLKSQNSIDSFLMQKTPLSLQDRCNNFAKTQVSRSVLKYPSDSESIGTDTVLSHGSTVSSQNPSVTQNQFFLNTHSGVTSFNRHTPIFSTNFPNHMYNSPKMKTSNTLVVPINPHSIDHTQTSVIKNPVITEISGGNNSIGHIGGSSSSDKFDMDYSPTPIVPNHHLYNSTIDYQFKNQIIPMKNSMINSMVETSSSIMPTRDHDECSSGYNPIYEGGTFPRKKEHQRFRIPSNHSVTSKGSGVKNSTGSIDHHSERGSPMPTVHVEILSHGAQKRNSNISDFLCPGDLRRVTIDKSDKSLGITILCNNNGNGIFVSSVQEKSIASRAGLQIGDQLLEVCGINMRQATSEMAAQVLRQCGNSITMLVQYNPEKYDVYNKMDTEQLNHSGSPTPRNSPRPAVRPSIATSPPTSSVTLSSLSNTAQKPSNMVSVPMKSQKFADSLENQSDHSSQADISGSIFEEDPRFITLPNHKSKNLGIKLFGGNKVGIFVHDVQPDSPAYLAGIRKGDQILEYNGVSLRNVTAEQAANEISNKITDTVTMLVQNNIQKLNMIQDKTGDSFYIRVGFDRTGDLNDNDLRFIKDDVLYVDNTIFGGNFGQWRAWTLDEYGHKRECGLVPSQAKVEEELRLCSDGVECEGGSTRRGNTTARRSFFRRKKHQRSSSRDSKELASFSNTQLSYFSDSGMLNDDGGILSYQRVERLDYPTCRPVLVLGPLAEYVTDRLTIDFPLLFQHCIKKQMDYSEDVMKEGIQKNIFVDYRRKGNKFECTTVESIRNSCKNNRHCVLDISITAVERLQRLQIYPIVLLLRFKSAKQIKEIKDPRYSTDKISAKAAKEMFERALKLEADYKQYISTVIPAGVNITHMSTQIKASVEEEQSKVLWVPISGC
ncbi:disks large homolog 5 [Condylostylus longicornis]|uniref:disks large homolog 5 n=1 Tax=Condylostylus longicornis TaxID=2530218 RepID=UPI00244E3E4D|nr:disks large homolog 5 [Condylostylus longicornis]